MPEDEQEAKSVTQIIVTAASHPVSDVFAATETIASEPWVGLANLNQSELALFSECTPECAPKELDTADIVRDGDFTSTTNLADNSTTWLTNWSCLLSSTPTVRFAGESSVQPLANPQEYGLEVKQQGGTTMSKINYVAVVVAAVAAFVIGAVWYSPLLFGKAYMEVRGMNPAALANMRPHAGELLGEFVKNLVVALVLAYFVMRLGVSDWKAALQMGLWVWFGFQAMLLMGAVLHEQMPWGLYAIHAGDALVKTLSMTVILGVWRK